jgi:hypothetical protein
LKQARTVHKLGSITGTGNVTTEKFSLDIPVATRALQQSPSHPLNHAEEFPKLPLQDTSSTQVLKYTVCCRLCLSRLLEPQEVLLFKFAEEVLLSSTNTGVPWLNRVLLQMHPQPLKPVFRKQPSQSEKVVPFSRCTGVPWMNRVLQQIHPQPLKSTTTGMILPAEEVVNQQDLQTPPQPTKLDLLLLLLAVKEAVLPTCSVLRKLSMEELILSKNIPLLHLFSLSLDNCFLYSLKIYWQPQRLPLLVPVSAHA